MDAINYPDRHMRVLFIANRAPYGRMVGHKMGMRTYIQSLQGLGHTVIVAAFAIPGDEVKSEDLNATTRYLKLPSKTAILRNVFTKYVPGHWSLNECLYASDDANRAISQMAREFSADIVVADTLRTARYAENTGLPWFLDHEDLLSERYAAWAGRSSGKENILGYLEKAIPALARPTVRWIFGKVLQRESTILNSRELYWTDRALASSLRSTQETERLGRRTNRPVFCMPVTVPIPPTEASSLETRPMTAVFVGGLTYQPNLDAIRAYVQQIIPEFERRKVDIPVLNVVGASPDTLRKGLDHPSVRFLGYVPDVNEEIQKAQVFFAPIVSGTGIKTKVLEALACGVPLIALPLGLTGLRGEDARHYLRANDAADFVKQYERLRDNLSMARSLGSEGRKLAVEFYSLDAAIQVMGKQVDANLEQAERHR